MNTHKNVRLTFEGRKLLVECIAAMELMPAAEAAGISARTARKWRQRFEQLRRPRMPMRRIAAVVGRSVSASCSRGWGCRV